MKEPMLVEIIAYAPTAFHQCMRCEIALREVGKAGEVQREQVDSSLPSELMDEYRALSDWVRTLFRVHYDRLVVKVVDAASIEGVFKSLRYGTRPFPAVIVDRGKHFSGKDAFTLAADEIGRLLSQPGPGAAPA